MSHALQHLLEHFSKISVVIAEVATANVSVGERASHIKEDPWSQACVCAALWARESTTISETSPLCSVHGNQTMMASLLLSKRTLPLQKGYDTINPTKND